MPWEEKDITGKKIGKLTAICKKDGKIWEFQCDCGNIVTRHKYYVKIGPKSEPSCGCTIRLSIAGQKFGKLTAIKGAGSTKHSKKLWECECECGNKSVATASALVSGNTKSCGCEKYTSGLAACLSPESREKKSKTLRISLHKPGVQERKKATCVDRYGFPSPSQNPEIARKQARAIPKSTILYHWKTGDEVVCRGSYEVKAIGWLNDNKVQYEWQVHFLLPSGKVYICDAYLPEFDKYIEIKGYWRKDAAEKWSDFQKIHTNSEVWDRAYLKKAGIL